MCQLQKDNRPYFFPMTQLNHTVTLLEDITISVHKDRTNRERNRIKDKVTEALCPLIMQSHCNIPVLEKKKKKDIFLRACMFSFSI